MNRILTFIVFSSLFYPKSFSTLPNNVFRLTFGKFSSELNWSLNNYPFSLDGIGYNYFNLLEHNDSIRFSSNQDLYHLGSTNIDSISTTESWMINFNENHGYTLPTFGPQSIDTSQSFAPRGSFSENKKNNGSGIKIKLEYGMSNDITLVLSIPFYEIYKTQQLYSNLKVDRINQGKLFLESHSDNKLEFDNFFNSNNFSNLHIGIRDTLQMIYNMFYTDNGQYSVNWLFHAQDDPINNLLIDNRFLPKDFYGDSVSIEELVSYYYPRIRTGSGVGDIDFGFNILILGMPEWSLNSNGNYVYVQLGLSIPFGKTLSHFLNSRELQFKEANIGNGSDRWKIGLYASNKFESTFLKRIFYQFQFQFSNSTTLNTPVELFSGGHTNPDSILTLVGNSYRFREGYGIFFNVGIENQIIERRIHLVNNIKYNYISKDNYTSKNKNWDSWMERYSSTFPLKNRINIKSELWILNSFSKLQLGAIPFDLCFGIISDYGLERKQSEYHIFSSIRFHFQGW